MTTPRLAKPLPLQEGVIGDAVFSECGRFRYRLSRFFVPDPQNVCVFVCMNPSAADATNSDDSTVRKLQKYARAWGHDGIYVLNAWSLRATDSIEMRKFYKENPSAYVEFEPRNYEEIKRVIQLPNVTQVVCAWGVVPEAEHCKRHVQALRSLLKQTGKEISVLRINVDRSPAHPLYLPDNLKPVVWV